MIFNVMSGGRVPVKMWTPLNGIEDGALEQLTNVSNMPFVFKHVAVMPDVHVGKGATVGSVIATKGAIIPATVGVDIGCGMTAVKTNLTSHDFKTGDLHVLRGSIEDLVPVGFNGRSTSSMKALEWASQMPYQPNAVDFTQKFVSQLGTLGGGNHFIEVCVDTEDTVWVVLHSGSRNFGKSVAEVHIKKAKAICEQMFVRLTDPDLAYLAEGTKEYDNYLSDVELAQDYAAENRKIMLMDIIHAMRAMWPIFAIGEMISCHHNYIARENHYGNNVLVTRKGAIRARTGDLGIIPGSMGTKSYIVRGLGNAESFNSCSHGAGRRMSRGAAKKAFTLEDLERQTIGVECRKDAEVLDEIPGAYKDIDVVMSNQSDLVEIVATLKQVLCIKG